MTKGNYFDIHKIDSNSKDYYIKFPPPIKKIKLNMKYDSLYIEMKKVLK